MIKLKPCPFCGKKPSVVKRRFDDESDNYTVKCANTRCGVFVETIWRSKKEESIKTWNKRADEAYSDDGK